MKKLLIILTFFLMFPFVYAGDNVTFNLSPDDNAKIEQEVKGINDYILQGYDYRTAGDVVFNSIVQNFLDRTRKYLEKKTLVDKAEEYYRIQDIDGKISSGYIGTSGLPALDEAVKGDLGYNGTDVDKEIDGIARVFKYEIYSTLFVKNGIQASPYAGWKNTFSDLVNKEDTPIPTEKITEEIDKLIIKLNDIKNSDLKKAEDNTDRVKKIISLKSANYIEHSELENSPKEAFTGMYSKEELLRYSIVDQARIKQKVVEQGIQEHIATLEWMKVHPAKNAKDIEEMKLKIRAYKKYVAAHRLNGPINFSYNLFKGTESSVYMMVALAVQDIAFYKFPDVFLTKEKAAFYKQFTDKTFVQYMQERFWNRHDLSAWKSFGAFAVTSHIIRAVPTPNIVLKMSRWADKKMLGVGGTRIRGVFLFSISMTVASKVSEAVSLYSRLGGELKFDINGLDFVKNSNDADITDIQNKLNALAKEYFGEAMFGEDFFRSTGNFLLSFGASEMVMKQLTGRIPRWGYYGKNNKLNRTKCAQLRKGIYGVTRYLVNNPLRSIFLEGAPMFLLASFIEKYLEIFEDATLGHTMGQDKLNKIYQKMVILEYKFFITGLKAYMDDPSGLNALYDKMDDLRDMQEIISYVRTNESWIIGTVKRFYADTSKDVETRDTNVDKFLTELFSAIQNSKINASSLSVIESLNKPNVDYNDAIYDIYSKENTKQLEQAYEKNKELMRESGDTITRIISNIDTDIFVEANKINNAYDVLEQKLFSNIEKGIWNNEQEILLSRLIKKRYKDDFQKYVDFYTTNISKAFTSSKEPDKKLSYLLHDIYPKYIESPLMQENDYSEFDSFGEDILNAIAVGIYSDFMDGIRTLPNDSVKYWTYMDHIMSMTARMMVLEMDENKMLYTDRVSCNIQMTMLLTLGTPIDMAGWGFFKKWKEDPSNMNKTYKDYAYEKWRTVNPKNSKKSFDDYAAEKWADILRSTMGDIRNKDTKEPLTQDEIKKLYDVQKARKQRRGL